MTKLNLALLISGSGSTATAIIKSCNEGTLAGLIKPVLVIASTPLAKGIEIINNLNCLHWDDVITIDPTTYPSREEFGKAIIAECHIREVDIIGQYGWMVKTPKNVIDAFPNHMINQHPGPLDPGHLSFGGKRWFGMRVHCARLEFVRQTNRDFWTEATAQRVHENFDEGARLGAVSVKINNDDTPETLQQRVLPHEHALQISVLKQFALGTVKEQPRQERLVYPEEETLLHACLENACIHYPHG